MVFTTNQPIRDTPKRITVATDHDLPAIMALQRRWVDDVGYIYRSAHAYRIALRGTILIWENDEPAGYIMTHPRQDAVLTVKQVAVHPDLLRSTHGTQMMHRVITHASRHHCTMLRLKSRTDLPANDFWPTLGFHRAGRTRLITRRRTPVYEWTLDLTASQPIQSAQAVPAGNPAGLIAVPWRS